MHQNLIKRERRVSFISLQFLPSCLSLEIAVSACQRIVSDNVLLQLDRIHHGLAGTLLLRSTA
jgi:hypothetical protein